MNLIKVIISNLLTKKNITLVSNFNLWNALQIINYSMGLKGIMKKIFIEYKVKQTIIKFKKCISFLKE